MLDLEFTFTAELWMYQGKGAWFFITLPEDESQRIRFLNGSRRRGWGAVRVTSRIGKTEWKTSIFPYAKVGGYILPVKADIRKKENITAGDRVEVTLGVSA